MDELDRLIRWVLCESAGRAQPPAYVWERIERKVQRRMAGKAMQRMLVSVWEEVKRNVRRRMACRAEWYAGRGGLYQPMTFSVWESRIPLSLVCVIEQSMPVLLGVGWAT